MTLKDPGRVILSKTRRLIERSVRGGDRRGTRGDHDVQHYESKLVGTKFQESTRLTEKTEHNRKLLDFDGAHHETNGTLEKTIL